MTARHKEGPLNDHMKGICRRAAEEADLPVGQWPVFESGFAACAKFFDTRKARDPRIAVCHPERPHYAKGFCRNCYPKQAHIRAQKNARARERRATDPEYAERQREACRIWRKTRDIEP